jgi:hypothetical protein
VKWGLLLGQGGVWADPRYECLRSAYCLPLDADQGMAPFGPGDVRRGRLGDGDEEEEEGEGGACVVALPGSPHVAKRLQLAIDQVGGGGNGYSLDHVIGSVLASLARGYGMMKGVFVVC